MSSRISRCLAVCMFALVAITAALTGSARADDGFEWRKIAAYKVVPLYVRPTRMSPIHEVMAVVQVKAPAAKVESFMMAPSSLTQFIGRCSKATLARTKDIGNTPEDYYLYTQIKFAAQSDFLAHWTWTRDAGTGKVTAQIESVPSDLEYDGIRRLKYFASTIEISPIRSSVTEIRVSMIVDPGKEQRNMSTDDVMGVLHETGLALRHLFSGFADKEIAATDGKLKIAKASELMFDQKKAEQLALKTQPIPVNTESTSSGSTSTIESFSQAMRMAKEGKIEKATPMFEKAYAANKKLGPMIAAQYELQGEIALDYNGDMERAASYYKTAEKFRGGDGEVARTLLAKGVALEKTKSPRAERYVQCAMMVDPKYGEKSFEEKKEEVKPVAAPVVNEEVPVASSVAKEKAEQVVKDEPKPVAKKAKRGSTGMVMGSTPFATDEVKEEKPVVKAEEKPAAVKEEKDTPVEKSPVALSVPMEKSTVESMKDYAIEDVSPKVSKTPTTVAKDEPKDSKDDLDISLPILDTPDPVSVFQKSLNEKRAASKTTSSGLSMSSVTGK